MGLEPDGGWVWEVAIFADGRYESRTLTGAAGDALRTRNITIVSVLPANCVVETVSASMAH